MGDPNLRCFLSTETIENLEVASGIGGGDNFGTGGAKMTDFAFLEPRCGGWLRDIVNAGTAAAPGGFGTFAEFVARE